MVVEIVLLGWPFVVVVPAAAACVGTELTGAALFSRAFGLFTELVATGLLGLLLLSLPFTKLLPWLVDGLIRLVTPRIDKGPSSVAAPLKLNVNGEFRSGQGLNRMFQRISPDLRGGRGPRRSCLTGCRGRCRGR